MKRFLSGATIIIPLLFAPFTVLILFSQNTVPGDFLYAYKRGLEIMVLVVASLNPTTKAYFHADLSDRRYAEAESLLLVHDVSGLSTFVNEVTVTQLAIAGVSDLKQQEQLNAALIAKIDNYQNGLAKIQTQVQVDTTQALPLNPTRFEPTLEQQKVQQQEKVSAVEQNQASPTPVLVTQQRVIEERVVVVYVTATPVPNITQHAEPAVSVTTDSRVISTPTPQPPTPTVAVVQQKPSVAAVAIAISETQDELKKIKEKVKQNQQPALKQHSQIEPSVTPLPKEKENNPIPTQGVRSEKKGDNVSSTKHGVDSSIKQKTTPERN